MTSKIPGTEPLLKVLFVEDNRLNAVLFEEAMRMRGDVDMRSAETGAQALAYAADWTPHLFILDAHLPDTTGYALLEKLRAHQALKNVPAVMCSADAYPEDLERAKAAGFAGYWTKPLDLVRVNGDLDTWCKQLGLTGQRCT